MEKWRKTNCTKISTDSDETDKLANGFVHKSGKKYIESKDDKSLFYLQTFKRVNKILVSSLFVKVIWKCGRGLIYNFSKGKQF